MRYSRRVLVAVGEARERERLCLVLRSLGHRVEAAADGAEGLDRAVHTPPEVVLLDVGLPLLNGYQLAELLRAVLGDPVRLLAYGDPAGDADERWREAGFDAYVVRPAPPDKLASSVTEAD